MCGYRELENWVRTFQAIKDVRRAAQVAVISKATTDPEGTGTSDEDLCGTVLLETGESK